ncbi:unnamed protein product [Oikopleura dioica]|uniref:Uncharacterized protein n=1 Tax=Oikopleura dioica TaxID=34765 RepID=E4Y7J0_OIKDI|nr:unnamed protein product [Oikopleura dioica]
MHQRPSICTVIIGIVMFISGIIAIALEFIDDDAETGFFGLILGMSICGTGMVLFTGGLTWLCCQKPPRISEILSNKAASLSNSFRKSDTFVDETNYRKSEFGPTQVKSKTLDPRTEDPTARRAVTRLVFRDCPDDRIDSLEEKVEMVKKEETKKRSKNTSVSSCSEKSSSPVQKTKPVLQKSKSILRGTSFYDDKLLEQCSIPSPPKIRNEKRKGSRSHFVISDLEQSKIHEIGLENGEIKLILYRERKRQLEEELGRRLKREAIYQELIRSEYLTLQPPYRSSPIPDYSPRISSRSLDRRFYQMNSSKMSPVHIPYGKPFHISEMKFTHAYIPKM